MSGHTRHKAQAARLVATLVRSPCSAKELAMELPMDLTRVYEYLRCLSDEGLIVKLRQRWHWLPKGVAS